MRRWVIELLSMFRTMFPLTHFKRFINGPRLNYVRTTHNQNNNSCNGCPTAKGPKQRIKSDSEYMTVVSLFGAINM